MADQENKSTVRSGAHYQPTPRAIIAILLMFALVVTVGLREIPAISVSGKVIRHHTTSSAVEGVTTTTVGRSQVRVQVANGTKTAGLAAAVTQRLMTQGWNMLPRLNGPRVGHTTIYYRDGFAAEAAAIRQFLSAGTLTLWTGASPIPGALDDQIIVLLGPDITH